MNKTIIIGSFLIGLVGCATSDVGEGTNYYSCIAPDSTYIESFELISGNCPEKSEKLFNTHERGIIYSGENEYSTADCQEQIIRGCDTMYTNCEFVDKNGKNVTINENVSFKDNADWGSGLQEVTTDDCQGIYKLKFEIQ
jgi:hypothetical protein